MGIAVGERLAYEYLFSQARGGFGFRSRTTMVVQKLRLVLLVFALHWLDSKPSCHCRLAGLPSVWASPPIEEQLVLVERASLNCFGELEGDIIVVHIAFV